jgi:hypothetical protein
MDEFQLQWGMHNCKRHFQNMCNLIWSETARGTAVFEVLRYKPEGKGFYQVT